MTHKALVVFGDGSEEIEFSCPVDILNRGGFTVTTASTMPGRKNCVLSRGMKVEADVHISEVSGKQFDVIVVPGGMPGAKHCAESSDLVAMLKSQKSRGAWYAAICASPAVVFKGKGIVSDEKMVCYDYKDFNDMLGSNMGRGRVAVSGKCITSVGPSSAIDFALGIVECIIGKSKADHVAKDILSVDRHPPVVQ